MEALNYQELYTLQNKLLSIIFSEETNFYLTGGTCLHRFYFAKRHSDDLDLFTSENTQYREDLRVIMDRLASESVIYQVSVDTRDFARLIIQKKLRIDLVNDRVFRYGKLVRTEHGIVLDNLENIAANKICAILGRDDPKDIFDLYTIYAAANIDWQTTMSAAARKCALDMETLEYRLASFPLKLLDLLSVTDLGFIDEIKGNYKRMVKHIAAAM
ncbi:MAG: nucleotidyl transferase AbiEii/AbiGii toxin family protein [Desulfohalobiaceae bacterium]|nr:nucleotidyl transferase AbiEii/AbiGii toxin family protein [Desulfohalobiaceae bacterium]